MSLYPAYLKLITKLRKVGITLHLTHPPRLVDQRGHPLTGVNARYHGDEDGSPIDWVVRVAVQNAAQALQAINVVGPNGRVILLVESPDIVVVRNLGTVLTLPQVVGIELGNEVDLTGLGPDGYGQFLEQSYLDLQLNGFRGDVISGGVSRVRPDTLAWLRRALRGVDPRMLMGIHRYSIDNDATKPQDGYVNRDEECNAILDTAGVRRVAVTEFGYPLLDPVGEADIARAADNVKVDLDFFSRMGCKYALYYQWLNGGTNTPIDRFGISDKPSIQQLLRG